jgi:glycosyltransferase involved in cell wall biosynthesis
VRVGVDGRSLVGGGARGVAHYTAALLEALAREFPGDEYRVLLPRGEATVPAGVVPVRSALPARALFGAAAVAGRPSLSALLPGCEVVLLPAPAPVAVRGPYVLTVHDRSWEERPQDFTAYERLWHRAARPRRLARRAARVLCDTDVVRGEVVRAWGVAPERVRTVPLAPRALSASTRAEGRYFLFVGALEPRKAPDVLAEGFRLARERGLDAELWVVGEGRMEVEGARRLGRVDDLGALYAGALAVVLPSWLEGFGLPPVEGLAAGAPAIVSDLPVLREVLGGGALYVPTGDATALADAMLALARDADLRSGLLATGREHIAPLSWAATARRTRAVLAEAVEEGERRFEGKAR